MSVEAIPDFEKTECDDEIERPDEKHCPLRLLVRVREIDNSGYRSERNTIVYIIGMFGDMFDGNSITFSAMIDVNEVATSFMINSSSFGSIPEDAQAGHKVAYLTFDDPEG